MMVKLLIDSGWLLIANVLGRATVVFSSVLLARWLGKDQFGFVAIIQSTVLMFGGFLGIGFGITATKILAAERTKRKSWPAEELTVLSWSNFALVLVAASLLAIYRVQISQITVGSDDLSHLLVPAAWLLVVTAVNYFQSGIMTGQENFRGAALASGLSSLITVPAILIGVLLGGAEGAVWGHALGMTLSCAVFQKAIAIGIPTDARVTLPLDIRNATRFLWRDAFPNVLLCCVNAPVDWLCLSMLIRACAGPGEAALFSACNQWCLLLRFLPMTVASALLPAVAQASAAGKATRGLVIFAVLTNCIFAAVFALALSLASPWIMACYGPDFAGQTSVMVVLLAAGTAIAVQLAADRVLAALNLEWLAFGINAVRGLVYISMAAGLVAYGAIGLAVARCVSSVLHGLAAAVAAYVLAGRRDQARHRVRCDGLLEIAPHANKVRAA